MMPDREKVIKGLECCTFILGKRKCNECPYQPDNGCYQLQDDFHALLKEQAAVKPSTCHRLFICTVCKAILFRGQKFCHECGKRIEWKGR